MLPRLVTENDFRKPEFRDARPEDYEFNGSGEVVRKDRWERAVREIVSAFEAAGHRGLSSRRFELDVVVSKVQDLLDREVLTRCQADCDGDCTHGKCPQRADDEPHATGRHCPLDHAPEPD